MYFLCLKFCDNKSVKYLKFFYVELVSNAILLYFLCNNYNLLSSLLSSKLPRIGRGKYIRLSFKLHNYNLNKIIYNEDNSLSLKVRI